MFRAGWRSGPRGGLRAGRPAGAPALARRRQRLVSHVVQSVAVVLLAAPPFLIGLLLIFFLAVEVRIFPVAGWGSGVGSDLGHLALPAFALSGYLIPLVVRTVRQAALDASSELFVEAAIARGISSRSIMYKHILPNSFTPVLVLATLQSGGVVVETAGLSFLGLGAQPPSPDWGALLADGHGYFLTAWWIATFPGLAIFAFPIGMTKSSSFGTGKDWPYRISFSRKITGLESRMAALSNPLASAAV